ncbi:MAG: transposase [Candidatus Competibacteraceae bacterium]|nr:transposase [Candidatus Competibacteraceae bacterium]
MVPLSTRSSFATRFNTLADLKALLPAFQCWYNKQRLHSGLAYRTPTALGAHKVAARLS